MRVVLIRLDEDTPKLTDKRVISFVKNFKLSTLLPVTWDTLINSLSNLTASLAAFLKALEKAITIRLATSYLAT